MEIKTLGELCNIVSGGTPLRSKPEYWDNGTIPWIKIGDMKGKYITNADEYITQAGLDRSSAKMLPKGTILYTIFATLGEVGILEIDASTNQAIAGLTIKDKGQILSEYLYYYLKSKKGYVKTIGRGVAQSNINMSILKSFQVPLPASLKQKEIVDILDKTSNIIKYRQQELQMLDNLIKARFVEMFGDPVSNPYKLPMVFLGELSELITKGASPSWQGFNYTDDPSQTLFLTSENVKNGYIDLSSPKYIEDKFNTKQKRSIVHKGDFLINIVGASIGRAAQFNLNCKANMNQAAALVRINDNRIRDKYLLTYLNSDKAQLMYNSMKSDTGRANLSLKDISELSILLPSIEEQLIFEKFVSQIDKSKATVQKALDETQLLFDSLMQQYFG